MAAVGRLEEIIRRIRAEDAELCRRGIEHVAIFGSQVRGDTRASSDVDIAVDIAPGSR
jgi:predicted nucleotidyltransferase